MLHLLWIIPVVIAALYLWLIAPSRVRPETDMGEGLFAHRGLHGPDVSENSLRAFELACEAGYGIELDVQLTEDHRLVVFHDGNLKRVCGVDKPLHRCTYEELSHYPLPDGSVIPLFSDVLRIVNSRVPLMVEIKADGDALANARAALDLLQGYQGTCCVESFDPRIVRYFRKNAPHILRGQLAMGHGRKNTKVSAPLYCCMKLLVMNFYGRPHFISYSHSGDAPLSFVRRLFSPITAAWTIREHEHLLRARRKGYNWVIFEQIRPERKHEKQ